METLNYTDQKIGEIVANDFRKAEVFKKYGIDFCCGGKKELSQVCLEKGISTGAIEQALAEIDILKNVPSSQEFNSWKLDFLVDYILNTHHNYVNESVPLLLEFTDKIARVHGEEHPELLEIKALFLQVAEELYTHMLKEENILFPFIKNLQKAINDKLPFTANGSIESPISVMEHEHEAVGSLFKRIKELSNSYQLPHSACNSYRFTFGKLEEFENDLHQHIHLENNILFPKALLLEKS